MVTGHHVLKKLAACKELNVNLEKMMKPTNCQFLRFLLENFAKLGSKAPTGKFSSDL